MTEEKTILGIDPGTRIMGYGLIKTIGRDFRFIDMGVLNMTRISDPLERLEKIHEEIYRLVEEHRPDCLSIETPFYGKNVQSLIKLGRAQGVAIAAAMALGLEVHEYAPLKIKQSLTGKGSASKEQVCAMVFRLLNIRSEQPRFLDASDALAAAICHGINARFDLLKSELPRSGNRIVSGTKKKKGNWADYLASHPDRIL